MAVDRKLPQVTLTRAWKDPWHYGRSYPTPLNRRPANFGRSGGVTMDVSGSTRSSLSMTPDRAG